MTTQKLYRVPDAMRLLSLSRSVIYEQIRTGRLKSVTQGRTLAKRRSASSSADPASALSATNDRPGLAARCMTSWVSRISPTTGCRRCLTPAWWTRTSCAAQRTRDSSLCGPSGRRPAPLAPRPRGSPAPEPSLSPRPPPIPPPVPLGNDPHGLPAWAGGSEWENFAVDPDAYVCEGDSAVVIGICRGTYRATGRTREVRFAHAWQFRDGGRAGSNRLLTPPAGTTRNGERAAPAGARCPWRQVAEIHGGFVVCRAHSIEGDCGINQGSRHGRRRLSRRRR